VKKVEIKYLWEVLWKSLVVFVLLIGLSRLLGRKLLSQMTFADFTVAVTVGTISGAFVVTTVKGLYVLFAPVILVLAAILIAYLNIKSIPARKIIEGEPILIIQNGKLLKKNMLRLRYSIDDLEMQLRSKNVFNFSEVEFALVESNGQLSVLKKSQHLPATPQDLGKPTGYKGLSTEIIKDGDVLEQNLGQNNLDFKWLYNELAKYNVSRVDDVFYAALNTDGTLYIDLKGDTPQYKQTIEDG